MASLKEIKIRIGSVKSTRKITSAMKMIASSKLHKATSAIVNFLPYQQKLDAILTNILASDLTSDSPFVTKREVRRAAIVVFASNSTLCGGYNATVIKELAKTLESYQSLGAGAVDVYPVGKKIEEAVVKHGIKPAGTYQSIAAAPTFAEIRALSEILVKRYVAREIDEVTLVFQHFKSTGVQKITRQRFLPFDLSRPADEHAGPTQQTDYIYESTREEILDSLIPTVLNARLFAAALDAAASEHAARMMAMQTATDNADELIGDLTIQFNKTRQQAVTNELLDIIGGASAT